MKQPVINLETSFPAYRIRMSLDHERGHDRDPWNFEIPCRRWHGAIYPHGGTRLQAQIGTGHVKKALALLEAVGAVPWQVGDGEATVLFELADFDRVAAVLLPKLKPKGRSAEDLAAIRPVRRAANEGQTGGSDEKAVHPGQPGGGS